MDEGSNDKSLHCDPRKTITHMPRDVLRHLNRLSSQTDLAAFQLLEIQRNSTLEL